MRSLLRYTAYDVIRKRNSRLSCLKCIPVPLLIYAIALTMVFAVWALTARAEHSYPFSDDEEHLSSGPINSNQLENPDYLKIEEESVTEGTPEPPLLIPPTWEEPTLLNLTGFQWLVNNPTRCQQSNSSRKRLVPVLVHTAADHFKEREFIRKTWGSVKDSYGDWDVKPVFLLGMQNSNSNLRVHKKRLLKEREAFGDLVIGNFRDTYKNLSYKHIMGYKWVLNFCPNASFVLKIDDDIFVDIYNWLDWRKEEMSSGSTLSEFYCISYGGTWPQRDPNNKWYVSEEEWPEKFFPDYCSGNAYGTSVDTIRKLYSVSKVKNFLWIDDAFLTGVLRRDAERKYNWKPVIKDIWRHFSDNSKEKWETDLCENKGVGAAKWAISRTFKSIVVIPREDIERDYICLWNKILFDRYIGKQLNQYLTNFNVSLLTNK